MKWPTDTLQASVEEHLEVEWWEDDPGSQVLPGSLVRAFSARSQIPDELVVEDRMVVDQHDSFRATVKAFNLKQKGGEGIKTPVAGLPSLDPGERRIVVSGKARPSLVLGLGQAIPYELVKGYPKHQRHPGILVAPYFGALPHGNSSGWPPALVERIRRCEFPQFVWDKLPHEQALPESLLRLDHCHTVYSHHQTIEKLGFRLTDEALLIIHDYFCWLLQGSLPPDSLIQLLRSN